MFCGSSAQRSKGRKDDEKEAGTDEGLRFRDKGLGVRKLHKIVDTIGAFMITCTILGVPYHNYSIMGPKALFSLLRPYVN